MKLRTRKFVAIGECMVEVASMSHSAHYKVGFAGDTLNTAIYLARYVRQLGVDVDYITALGDDVYSQHMIEAWQAENIGTHWVAQLPGEQAGLYLIHNDDNGERYFTYYRSQSAAKKWLQTQLTDKILSSLHEYDYIYLSGISLAILSEKDQQALIKVLSTCNKSQIVFDPNYRVKLWPSAQKAREVFAALLPHVSIGLPTLDNEQELFDDQTAKMCAQRWHGFGVSEVVVKQGEQACLVSQQGEGEFVDSLSVDTVVDTTSAGDSFNAAYLAARIQGYPVVKAAAIAHQLASVVIMHQGAIIPKEAMPSLF